MHKKQAPARAIIMNTQGFPLHQSPRPKNPMETLYSTGGGGDIIIIVGIIICKSYNLCAFCEFINYAIIRILLGQNVDGV